MRRDMREMFYIGSVDALTERYLTRINPHQGIPTLDYTVRSGEVFEPLYFETRREAENALKLFKAWCKRNYGSVQHRLLENPTVIAVECKAQYNLF